MKLTDIPAWVSYRTYYRPSTLLSPCTETVSLTRLVAPLKHHQCHMPLAPIEPGSEDEESGMNHHVRLLEEEEGVPRPSEEELAWRSG